MQKISPPPGFDPPDRSAHSESLYRLSYPGPQCMITMIIQIVIWANGIMKKGLKENLEAILLAGCLSCCVLCRCGESCNVRRHCLKCIILMSWKTSGTFGIPNLTLRDAGTDLFTTLKPGACPGESRTNGICKSWSTWRSEYAGGTG